MKTTTIELAKLETAVSEYLKNQEMTGTAENTLKSYRGALESYCFFARDFDAPEDCAKYRAVAAWRDSLLKKNALSTVNHRLKVLKMFFAWAADPALQESRYYETNPVANSLFPNMRKINARPYDMLLSDDDVLKLLINKPPKEYAEYKKSFWARNYAMVIVLLTTELRNSELRALRPCDLDFENCEIRVETGKGNKFRVVDFPELAQTAIRLYLASGFRPKTAAADDVLFGKFARPMDPKNPVWETGTITWLSQVIENHVFAVTGVKKITSHDLRHVGSRIDLNSGMRIEHLQAKLGHASPVITQVYSGRIMPRRNRASAQRVIDAQNAQAAENAEALRRLACAV